MLAAPANECVFDFGKVIKVIQARWPAESLLVLPDSPPLDHFLASWEKSFRRPEFRAKEQVGFELNAVTVFENQGEEMVYQGMFFIDQII